MTLHSTADHSRQTRPLWTEGDNWRDPSLITTTTHFFAMTLFIPASMTNLLPTADQLKAVFRTAVHRDYGPDLERIGRGLAMAIAFTYACGYALGCWLHQTNNQLSGFARQFNEPDWHQQRLAALKARLAVNETSTGDPQPALPLTSAPQPRTTRSKLPKPAPKPSRQRRPKGAGRTTAPALVA